MSLHDTGCPVLKGKQCDCWLSEEQDSDYGRAKHYAVNTLGYSDPDSTVYQVGLEDIVHAVFLGMGLKNN